MIDRLYRWIGSLVRYRTKSQWVKNLTGLVLILLSFVVFFVQRQNYLLDNMHAYNVDEVHTVYEATKTRPSSYRTGEGTRLLAKFLFPTTLIYMNKYLGDDHFREGWSYPGFRYVRSKYSQLDVLKRIGDPGLQDFFYFMRLQYAALFALVVTLFSLFLLYRENDRMSPFFHCGLPRR